MDILINRWGTAFSLPIGILLARHVGGIVFFYIERVVSACRRNGGQ